MTEFSRFSIEYGEDSGPRIGVSRCLLGEHVRYDGDHKHNTAVTQVLAQRLSLLPLCPEVEAGLGVPRPPVQLVCHEDRVRVLGVERREDFTDALQRIVEHYAALLDSLHGMVLKSRSPSCGVWDTPWFDEEGWQRGTGSGFLLRTLELPPHFPVVDELALEHAEARERFITKVFQFQRMSVAGPAKR